LAHRAGGHRDAGKQVLPKFALLKPTSRARDSVCFACSPISGSDIVDAREIPPSVLGDSFGLHLGEFGEILLRRAKVRSDWTTVSDADQRLQRFVVHAEVKVHGADAREPPDVPIIITHARGAGRPIEHFPRCRDHTHGAHVLVGIVENDVADLHLFQEPPRFEDCAAFAKGAAPKSPIDDGGRESFRLNQYFAATLPVEWVLVSSLIRSG
jgi:hypothetical protein